MTKKVLRKTFECIINVNEIERICYVVTIRNNLDKNT